MALLSHFLHVVQYLFSDIYAVKNRSSRLFFHELKSFRLYQTTADFSLCYPCSQAPFEQRAARQKQRLLIGRFLQTPNPCTKQFSGRQKIVSTKPAPTQDFRKKVRRPHRARSTVYSKQELPFYVVHQLDS